MSRFACDVSQLVNTDECAEGMLMVFPSGVMKPLVARLMDLATEVMKRGNAASSPAHAHGVTFYLLTYSKIYYLFFYCNVDFPQTTKIFFDAK